MGALLFNFFSVGFFSLEVTAPFGPAIGLEGWHCERSRALRCDIHAQSVVLRNGLMRYSGDARIAEATLLSPESK
jgi:hypothetical protein